MLNNKVKFERKLFICLYRYKFHCCNLHLFTVHIYFLSNLEIFNIGTDPKKAEELKNCLNVRKRRSNIVITNVEDRLNIILLKIILKDFSLVYRYII